MVIEIKLGRSGNDAHTRDEFLRRFAKQNEVDFEYAARVWIDAIDSFRDQPMHGLSLSLQHLLEDVNSEPEVVDDTGRNIRARAKIALANTFLDLQKTKLKTAAAPVEMSEEGLYNAYMEALRDPDPALRRALRESGYVARPRIDLPPRSA